MEGFEKPKSARIERGENNATVLFNHLELDAEHPNSPDVRVVVEKQPIHLNEGESYGQGCIRIDEAASKFKPFEEPMFKIKELPEAERPSALLALLREHTHYAYADVMEEVAKDSPEVAEWVAQNTGLGSKGYDVPLSEFLEKGYGRCTQLSVAYLYLAQQVGIEGCFMGSDSGAIKNVLKDENTKLFRSAEVGAPVGAHSWVELKLSDGRWIPVDPTTKLVGDTPGTLQLFMDANYVGIGFGVEVSINQNELIAEGFAPMFLPGVARAETSYHLRPKSTKPKLRLTKNEGMVSTPPTNEPFSGAAEMNISTERQMRDMKLSLIDVKA